MTWHLVTGDFPPRFTGGVATWTCAVAQALGAAGEEVAVVARGARTPAWILRETASDAGLPFKVRRVRGADWAHRQGGLLARDLVPRLRPGDRVLATTWPAATGLAAACHERGVPLLVAVHGSDVTRLQAAPPDLAALVALGTRFVAVSRFLAHQLAGLGVPARVLPAPVDRRDLRHGPGETLLVVARLTPLKGVDRALRLGAALGWPVEVVGDGPEGPSLRRLAATLGADARFRGRLEGRALDAAYQRARLLALLSRADVDGTGAEGLGLVVLEAAAWGVPAVVSPVGGLPEAAPTGLVLPDPDDVDRSVARVRAFLADGQPGLRAWEALEAAHGPARTARDLLDIAAGGRP